ncbi:trehalose-phosphatase [Streptacidiphilus sp. PB12-B1b]|uniref:trehalose-phosphatase n=1 Tax=Streptacidiphilus sp. PB12-B1b TaxID=2705012 RepID=UPI0015FC8AD0|nr:trehalose-phosphatase [Streptacidiphilus sp. PB12-B1b]QMU74925.1 trehalose-phosphatase [Streptacidiphilus sp. PB12-B1b]
MALPEPRTAAGAAGLAALLDDPARAVVALDFDGTLAPIVADPRRAHAHPAVVPALARLAPRLAAVAVVTGRPTEEAVRLGGFAGVPGLEHLTVLGHYGLERWDAATGELRAPEEHPGVAALRADLAALPVPEGTWVEDKGHAIAVHTRRTADPEAALLALDAPLRTLAERHRLAVEPGRMVLELRPPGMDKGVALTAFLREHKAGSVLFAGDDLGDLAAYGAVEALRDGSVSLDGSGGSDASGLPGLLVCSAPATGEPPVAALADRADLVVPGPDGVAALLTALADAL